MDKLIVDSKGWCIKYFFFKRKIHKLFKISLILTIQYILLILIFKGKVTISNDGATILKLLDIVHPAGKVLVDIARSQDAEVSINFFFSFKDFKL